jgi:hypothetical protein
MSRERHRIHEARYRERHREEINARRRAQYDPDVSRARLAKYKAKNLERFKELSRRRLETYRAKNRKELNERARKRYLINQEKEQSRRKAYRLANGDALRERARLVYDAKPERKARKAELERTEKIKATRRAYRQTQKAKEYAQTFEKTYRDRRKKLHEIKQASNPQYRLRRAIRANLVRSIKNQCKSGSAINMLGCSIDRLKGHLEAQFAAGMSWGNYGRLNREGSNWQIDHIHPLSAFDLTDVEQLRKACHFSNLRPLWALDNRRKANKVLGGKEVPYVSSQ